MIRHLVAGRRFPPVGLAAFGASFWLSVSGACAAAPSQFESEWAKLISAAQQEGRVIIASGGAPSREYRSVADLFQKKFNIRVSLSSGSGAASVDRVLAERSAGKYTVDLGFTSIAATRTRLIPAKALDPISQYLIHPDVVDMSLWFGGRHWYADPEEKKFSFLYAAEATETFDLWYNTKSISKNEIETIKSLPDLLDPKWRGKITSRTYSDRGRIGEMLNIYVQPDGGISWIRAFFNQADARFSDDVRLRESWVVGGSVPIAFGEGDIDIEVSKLAKAGMPVARYSIPFQIPFLNANSSGCCIQVYNRAPHGNAAKLFLNWFLSKEGQTAVHQITPGISRQSMREDIPLGNIRPNYVRSPGKQYVFSEGGNVAQDKEQRDAIMEAWKNRPTKR